MRKMWTPFPLIVAVGLVAVGLVATAIAANTADWSVAQASGKVSIVMTGAQPVALTKGAVLTAGGILTTGPQSRALLSRDQETMVIGANAAVAIPSGPLNSQFTTVLESAGLVEYTVDKQNVQHFAVETPYLAAVVKGTQFSVEVTPNGGTVSVTRGVVEVTALATGDVTEVTAGQIVTVANDGALATSGEGRPPTVAHGTPRRPLVAFGIPAGGPATPGNGNDLRASVGVGNGKAGNGAGNSGAVNGNARINASNHGAEVSADAGGGGASVSASNHGAEVSASVGGGGASVDAGPVHIGLGR
jgi:hypothetical protein